MVTTGKQLTRGTLSQALGNSPDVCFLGGMNHMKAMQKSHQAGFSLLEVLVGLVILAIGLLGLAGMQMLSLKQNNEAYLRSQATFQAYDILDKMRANRDLALDGEYEIDFNETPDNATLSDVVFDDLDAWQSSLASFPGPGEGSIAVTNGTMVNVTIRWRETSDQNVTGPWISFTTQTEL